MLRPFFERGMTFTVGRGTDWEVDLDTQAKSHCVLTLEDGIVYANMRYDTVKRIDDYRDIINAVRECDCHRNSMNYEWREVINVYDENGGYLLIS